MNWAGVSFLLGSFIVLFILTPIVDMIDRRRMIDRWMERRCRRG